MSGRWQSWIDRGGTFTDVAARAPDGGLATVKLLSEDPTQHDDAATAAIRRLTGCGDGPLPAADPAAIGRDARAHSRFVATDHMIEVAVDDPQAMRAASDAAHQKRFGFIGTGALVVETVLVEAISKTDDAALPAFVAQTAPPVVHVTMRMAGARDETPIHRRSGIATGDVIAGPALIVDATATTVVEPGWRVTADALGNLVLTRTAPREQPRRDDATADPVRLEIYSGLFMALAEEMGAALQHAASSVNIRERLDFSCALFEAHGNLIADAPHIPVHLGSTGEAIRTILARRGGGADGAPGASRIERAGGTVESLPGTASVEFGAGDVFVIETPGGGYGVAG